MKSKNGKKKTKPVMTKSEIKKKMSAVIPMLLLSIAMLVSVTFAWLVLSRNPEVSGVKTTIGANGSLEIALFNTESRNDYNKITSKIGDSSEKVGPVKSNVTWGNIVDLSDSSYGLDEITLYPARLKLTHDPTTDTYKVANGILSIPMYGKDGRVSEIDTTTTLASAVYKDDSFAFDSEKQTYGVRAIGSTSASESEKLLISAKSGISSSMTSMLNNAQSSVRKAAAVAGSTIAKHAMNKDATYNAADIADLKAAATEAEESAKDAETALRYGIVAKLATVDLKNISVQLPGNAEVTLAGLSAYVLDEEKPLSDIANRFAEYLPDGFNNYITKLNSLKTKATDAVSKTSTLSGDTFTYEQIKNVIACLVDQNQSFIGDKIISQVTKDDADSILKDCKITVVGSLYNDIADFLGDYDTTTDISVTGISVKATVKVGTDYDNDNSKMPLLKALEAAVKTYKAVASSGEDISIDTIYGYMLDLAFRCNADASDLQLQTSAKQRVYEDDETSLATMGSGSNMTLSMNGLNGTLTEKEALLVANNIRVAFVGEGNELLGIGKLDIANTKKGYSDDEIICSLYLYDYKVEKDANGDDCVVLGAPLPDESKLKALTRNKVTPVSVLVWLEGDTIDNSMVVSEGVGMIGILNLQFSSSAELTPMENNNLKNQLVDKSALKTKIDTAKETIDAGQKNYTSKSWDELLKQYIYAQNAYGDKEATPKSLDRASKYLENAKNGLTEASPEELRKLVEEKVNTIYDAKNKDEKGNPVYTEESYKAFEEYYQENIKFVRERPKEDSKEDSKKEPAFITPPSYSREYTVNVEIPAKTDKDGNVIEPATTEEKTVTEYTKIANLFANEANKPTENELNNAIAEVQAELDKLKPAVTYTLHTDNAEAVAGSKSSLENVNVYYKGTDGYYYTAPSNGKVVSDGKTLYDIQFEGKQIDDMYVTYTGELYRTPSTGEDKYSKLTVTSDTTDGAGVRKVAYNYNDISGACAIDFDALLKVAVSNDDSIDFKKLKWVSSNPEIVKIEEITKFNTNGDNIVQKDSRGAELTELFQRLFIIGTKPGSTVMTVSGYTKQNVYFTLSFTYTLYNKADGVAFNEGAETKINQDASATYTVKLTGEEHTEEIESVEWDFSQKLGVNVEKAGNSFTITNKNEQATDIVGTLTATVKTVQGNTYAESMQVTLALKVPPKQPEQQPEQPPKEN